MPVVIVLFLYHFALPIFGQCLLGRERVLMVRLARAALHRDRALVDAHSSFIQ